MSIILIALCVSSSIAADYDDIDVGDYYYINKFGDDNEYVKVIRKLDDGRVKVKNTETYDTKKVYPSKLLTKSELDNEEFENTAKGTILGLGLLYCLANPDECKQ
jgi:hypothetical protein